MKEEIEMPLIDPKSPEWSQLAIHLVNSFDVGDIIPHDWLKSMFRIPMLDMRDFPDTQSFIIAIQQNQFDYMGLFERLRNDVLIKHAVCLVNVRGEGYRIIPPKEQHTYAYSQLVKDIGKSFREASDIMTHVKVSAIDEEQKSKDRQLSSKMGHLKQLFEGFRK